MHLTLTRRLTCSIFLWPASKTVVPDFFSSGYSGLYHQPPIWQGFFALLRLLRKFQYENLLWSDSDIRTHLTIYLYYIVRFVCRSLDNNVKAAVVRARVGQSDGHGGGILNRRSGMPGWICCTRRSSWCPRGQRMHLRWQFVIYSEKYVDIWCTFLLFRFQPLSSHNQVSASPSRIGFRYKWETQLVW